MTLYFLYDLGPFMVTLVNMSIAAIPAVLLAVLFRLLFRRSPKWIRGILWAIVALRLICPISFDSPVSIVPSGEVFPEGILDEWTPEIESGIPVADSVLSELLQNSLPPAVSDVIPPIADALLTFTALWIVGVILMVAYAAAGYIGMRLRLRESIPAGDGLKICDRIATPFIFGVLRPRIYLPSSMNEGDREYVVMHERVHLRRLDHIFKPVGFFILTLHWFNPAVWAAYVLYCRDVELACDEKVIKSLGEDGKKSYSEALISCSAPRSLALAAPLAFGEVGVRQRIRNILSYRSPAMWITVLSVVLSVAAAVCLAGNRPAAAVPVPSAGTVTYTSSDTDGVTVKNAAVESVNGDLVLSFDLVNSTDDTVTCGNPFRMYRITETGGFVPLESDTVFTTIGYIILPGKTARLEYNLTRIFELEAEKSYRFRTDFFLDDDKPEEHLVIVDMAITDTE